MHDSCIAKSKDISGGAAYREGENGGSARISNHSLGGIWSSAVHSGTNLPSRSFGGVRTAGNEGHPIVSGQCADPLFRRSDQRG
jgi:hypothetical protein